MAVQPVSNMNQYLSALTTDFKNVQNNITTLETAQSSGKQDQVTLSKQALQQAMAQFQTDLTSLTQGAQTTQSIQATQGQHHHHHHHHNTHAANTSTSGSNTAGSTTTSLLASTYGSGVQTASGGSTVNLLT